ncbi:unnamed protein product [Lampetra fluviatilis]
MGARTDIGSGDWNRSRKCARARAFRMTPTAACEPRECEEVGSVSKNKGYVVSSATTEGAKMNKWLQANVSNDTIFPVENLQPNTK